VTRRGFLVMSSAAAATPMLGLWRAPAQGVVPTVHRLSIGYVAGSSELLDVEGPLLAGEGSIRVVRPSAADGPVVAGPARATAHGIYPASAAGGLGDKTVLLDVATSLEEGELSRPVYLWSRRGHPVESTSAPAGLNVPTGYSLGLQVAVSEGTDSYVARGRLGSTWAPLRRGIYLLAVGPASPLTAVALGVFGGPRASLVLSVDGKAPVDRSA
jgi:hypothetical protein